jgi:ABC-type antimicrobial peptide transport system permease subunit
MVVSGFLVVNVVNTIVVEQKRQIGVLKSIGATRFDNFFIYGGIAFTYGAIGTAFALIPGVLLGYQLALTLAPQLDILIEGFQLSWTSIIFGSVMGLVVPVLAAMIPVYNGTRVRIMDAITDLGIGGTYGQGPLAQFIGSLPLPFSFRQALSNIVQKKGRLALTGITLTLAIGSSMGVFAMGISLNKAVQDIFNRLDYQITVIPYEVQDLETTKQTLESLDEITTANPGVIMSIEIVGNYENFFTRNNQVVAFGVIPESGDYDWNYKAGTGWDNDPNRQGVVISAPMADQLGITAGDAIAFVVSGNQVTEEVIGIERAAFDAMWIHWEHLALLAGFVEGGPIPNQYIVIGSIGVDESPIFAFGMDGNAANLFNPGTGIPIDGVLITDVLAESQNIEEGDTVQLTIGDNTVARTVAGIVPYDRLVEEVSRFELDVPLVPENVAMFLFTDLVMLSGENEGIENATPLPNGYYLSTNLEDPSIEDVDEVIDIVEAALGEKGITSEIQNQVEQFSEISDLIVQYTAILSLAAILIAAVGAVGLLTTLTITVFERQKEIGVMRSIGAGSTAIGLQFMTEGILIGILAWIIGIPISYFLALGLNAAFRLETVKFTYPPEVLVFGLVGMILIAGLASLGPSLSAARKTVSDILRYQ